MSSAVLLSTAYFPPISYFCKIFQYEKVYLESDENYTKQTYRNRCNILGSNGPLSLTIPVQRSLNPKIHIQDIAIDFSSRWKTIHWRAIESAYRNSPFFLYYSDEIRDFFFQEEEKLFQFNFTLLKSLLDILGLSKTIYFSSGFKRVEESFDDFTTISPKNQSTDSSIEILPYYQVFGHKFNFSPDLSILDLIFNLGPSAEEHLRKCIQFSA